MSPFQSLRPAVKAYVVSVVAIGALVLAHSVRSLVLEPIGSEWLILATLTVFTGSFSVKVPSINAYISVSEAFVFASVLLFGSEAGTVTVLLECMVILLWMKPQGRPAHRMFFNMAAPSIAIWTAGHSFYSISGFRPYSEVFTPLAHLFLPLLAFTVIYFLLNSWLVAIAVGLETKCSPLPIWSQNFAWLSVNYFSGASLAALIVTYTQRLDFSTLVVIGPLLVVSYLTFRTAMGRVEDSYNHLAQLNRLYLSTIETLAMAIDAKDQITHGHIRRVQFVAVGLAKHLGVTDETLLKAIEAAALLHDMGKLAVPEHILNKPGKLTPAEFEKMKLHAGVGADILSAIDFPYPVVPIVRHHHENWDGTGYPAGISGTDIPIGARILSVVDCFDALTSDRPYRPKLSNEEALAILIERRGTMYDPLVVDTFVRVYRDISPEQRLAPVSSQALSEITTSSVSGTIRRGDASDIEGGRLHDQQDVHLDQNSSVSALLNNEIRAIVESDLAVFYEYDHDLDELVVKAVSDPHGQSLLGTQVGLGERLSGWVAANKRAIINSDPTLDLGDFSKIGDITLRNCLSVPVSSERELIGVLSFYSRSAFTEDHRKRAEAVAEALARMARFRTDSSAPLKTAGIIERRLPGSTDHVSSLVYVQLTNWQEILRDRGSAGLEEMLCTIGKRFRELINPTDLLVRGRESQFVVVLARAHMREVWQLSRRLRRAIDDFNSEREDEPRVAATVDAILAPEDPGSIQELLTAEFFDISTEVHHLSSVRVH